MSSDERGEFLLRVNAGCQGRSCPQRSEMFVSW